MITKETDRQKFSDGVVFSSMIFKGYGIELRPVTPKDLPTLRRWRNSPAIRSKMNDTSYITPRKQRGWFEYIHNRVDQAQWVVWCNGGKTGYVNVKGGGELSAQPYVSGGYYIAETNFRHSLVAYAVMMMYHDIIFEYMAVPLVKGNILQNNKSSLRLNRSFGYREGSQNAESISLTLEASDYANEKRKFLRYFKEPHCQLVESK
jgi:RimJ/RimL family protein N-acetyltransferase